MSFFHPYCDAGGGGERVLWVAIIATSKRFQAARFLVYTGDLGAAPDQVFLKFGFSPWETECFPLTVAAKHWPSKSKFFFLIFFFRKSS